VRRLYLPILCCMFIAAFVLAAPPEPKKCMCDPVNCAGKCFDGSEPCCCAEEPADELEGFWWVTTKDEKIGVVALHKGKESYLITWSYNPGVTQGVGGRVGDTLSVAWLEGGSKLGMVHYKMRREGGKVYVDGPTETWSRAHPPKKV
jgi:hypothetical protein